MTMPAAMAASRSASTSASSSSVVPPVAAIRPIAIGCVGTYASSSSSLPRTSSALGGAPTATSSGLPATSSMRTSSTDAAAGAGARVTSGAAAGMATCTGAGAWLCALFANSIAATRWLSGTVARSPPIRACAWPIARDSCCACSACACICSWCCFSCFMAASANAFSKASRSASRCCCIAAWSSTRRSSIAFSRSSRAAASRVAVTRIDSSSAFIESTCFWSAPPLTLSPRFFFLV